MQAALVEDGKVVNIVLLDDDFSEETFDGKLVVQSEEAEIGDDYINGKIVKPAPPPPEPETPEQTIARLEGVIDFHLDAVAQSYRYESIRTMVTYATSEHPTFGPEGRAAVKFRDECYSVGITILNQVKLGERGIPSDAELISEMPEFTTFL